MAAKLNDEQLKKVLNKCRGCENFKQDLDVGEIWCSVFNQFYWVWGEDPYCWARVEEEPEKSSGQQAREAFHEDSHRQILKPGKSEGQDNPLFGKERMRDNRHKEPWTEDFRKLWKK